MSLDIDYREKKLIELCNINKIEINIKNLNVGDAVFKTNEGDMFVIERKTVKDLYSSIKDGRLRQQKKRMLDSLPTHKILYIIEGNIRLQISCNKFIDEKSVYSSIYNILIRDNIPLINSQNIDETFKIIINLFEKYKENKSPFKNTKDTQIIPYSVKKKGDISKLECFQNQLCQIPGISIIKSNELCKLYPTMKDFITFLNNSKNPEKDLADINLNNKKLGVKQSNKILNYLGY